MLYRLYFLLPELYGYSTNSPNHQNMPVKQHLWFKSTLVQVEVECSSCSPPSFVRVWNDNVSPHHRPVYLLVLLVAECVKLSKQRYTVF